MSEPSGIAPHFYFGGVGHFTAPDDPIFSCCDKSFADPVHLPREPEKVCDCDALGFRHYYSASRCPSPEIVPHPHWVHQRTKATTYGFPPVPPTPDAAA